MTQKITELIAELQRLLHLSVADLQAEWCRTIGSAAPKNARRDYLLRGVAHEFQSRVFGDLSKNLRRALIKVADSGAESSAAVKGKSRSLKSGARIYRDWKGAVHEVEVCDDGYRYQGVSFKSLSVIARQITGTRWSGPAFFGLKKRPENIDAR